jgi:hypothetical protein
LGLGEGATDLGHGVLRRRGVWIRACRR